MADQGDDAGHDAHADDVVADELHQPADDHVKHTGIGHDAEVQNGEYEQRGGGSGGVEAGLDHGGQVGEIDPAAGDQDQTQEEGVGDEGDGGLGLAPEERHDHGDDGDQAENANYGVAHGGDTSFFTIVWFRAFAEGTAGATKIEHYIIV